MNCIEIIDKHIGIYERVLDRNENDCIDKALISAILEELKELKDEIESVQSCIER